jgi:solute carrier family 25 folate transporter 32
MQTFIHHEHAQKRIGLTELMQEMIQKEGWSAFYRGLGTNMVRVVPSTALSLWLYEYLKKSL